MALKCFIDESADESGSHTVVMTGYVADDETWIKFDADWRAELKSQKIQFAHFNSKIFKGGKAAKNAERFYRVIENHLNKAFCITCSVPEYRRTIASCRFPKSFIDSPKYVLLNDPHILLYRAFIELCFNERKKLEINEPVNLIFDKTDKYEEIVTSLFEYLYHSAEALGLDTGELGKKPIFEDDKMTPALQAADLLARLVRFNLVNNKPETEMPWEKNKTINHLITTIGEEYILGVFDSSFSQKNFEIYERYTKKKHYRLYDFLNRVLKFLPASIRGPIFRLLNKPLLLGN